MNEKIVKLNTLLQEIVDLSSHMDDTHIHMVEELCSSVLAVFADHDYVPMVHVEAPEEDGETEISPGVFSVRKDNKITIVKK